jgi:hypothetical protein
MKQRALTTLDLVKVFDVTPMTIYNWRNPAEGSRKSPLPCNGTGRNVNFNAVKIAAWANKNGVPMVRDPIDIAEGGSGEPRKKPGPKPREGGPRLTEKEVEAIALNPYSIGVAAENWRRGFNGERLIAAPGSLAAKCYAEGKAARKAADKTSKRRGEQAAEGTGFLSNTTIRFAEKKAEKKRTAVKKSALRA